MRYDEYLNYFHNMEEYFPKTEKEMMAHREQLKRQAFELLATTRLSPELIKKLRRRGVHPGMVMPEKPFKMNI